MIPVECSVQQTTMMKMGTMKRMKRMRMVHCCVQLFLSLHILQGVGVRAGDSTPGQLPPAPAPPSPCPGPRVRAVVGRPGQVEVCRGRGQAWSSFSSCAELCSYGVHSHSQDQGMTCHMGALHHCWMSPQNVGNATLLGADTAEDCGSVGTGLLLTDHRYLLCRHGNQTGQVREMCGQETPPCIFYLRDTLLRCPRPAHPLLALVCAELDMSQVPLAEGLELMEWLAGMGLEEQMPPFTDFPSLGQLLFTSLALRPQPDLSADQPPRHMPKGADTGPPSYVLNKALTRHSPGEDNLHPHPRPLMRRRRHRRPRQTADLMWTGPLTGLLLPPTQLAAAAVDAVLAEGNRSNSAGPDSGQEKGDVRMSVAPQPPGVSAPGEAQSYTATTPFPPTTPAPPVTTSRAAHDQQSSTVVLPASAQGGKVGWTGHLPPHLLTPASGSWPPEAPLLLSKPWQGDRQRSDSWNPSPHSLVSAQSPGGGLSSRPTTKLQPSTPVLEDSRSDFQWAGDWVVQDTLTSTSPFSQTGSAGLAARATLLTLASFFTPKHADLGSGAGRKEGGAVPVVTPQNTPTAENSRQDLSRLKDLGRQLGPLLHFQNRQEEVLQEEALQDRLGSLAVPDFQAMEPAQPQPLSLRHPITEGLPTSQRHTEGLPTSRHPDTEGLPTSQRHTEGLPTSQRHPDTEGLPTSQRHPDTEGLPTSQRQSEGLSQPQSESQRRHPVGGSDTDNSLFYSPPTGEEDVDVEISLVIEEIPANPFHETRRPQVALDSSEHSPLDNLWPPPPLEADIPDDRVNAEVAAPWTDSRKSRLATQLQRLSMNKDMMDYITPAKANPQRSPGDTDIPEERSSNTREGSLGVSSDDSGKLDGVVMVIKNDSPKTTSPRTLDEVSSRRPSTNTSDKPIKDPVLNVILKVDSRTSIGIAGNKTEAGLVTPGPQHISMKNQTIHTLKSEDVNDRRAKYKPAASRAVWSSPNGFSPTPSTKSATSIPKASGTGNDVSSQAADRGMQGEDTRWREETAPLGRALPADPEQDPNSIFGVLGPAAANNIHFTIRKRPGILEGQPSPVWHSPEQAGPLGPADRPGSPHSQAQDGEPSIRVSHREEESSSSKSNPPFTGMKPPESAQNITRMEIPDPGSRTSDRKLNPALGVLNNYREGGYNSQFLVNMAEIRPPHETDMSEDRKDQKSELTEDKPGTVLSAPRSRQGQHSALQTVQLAAAAPARQQNSSQTMELLGLGSVKVKAVPLTSENSGGKDKSQLVANTKGKNTSLVSGDTKSKDALWGSGDGSPLDRKETSETLPSGPFPLPSSSDQLWFKHQEEDSSFEKLNMPPIYRVNLSPDTDKLTTPQSNMPNVPPDTDKLTTPQSNMPNVPPDTDKLTTPQSNILPDKGKLNPLFSNRLNQPSVTDNRLNQAPVTDNRLNQAPVTDNRLNQAPVTDNRLNQASVTDNRLNQAPVTNNRLNTSKRPNLSLVTDNRPNLSPVTDNRLNFPSHTDNRMNLPPDTDTRLNLPPDTDNRMNLPPVTDNRMNLPPVTDSRLNQAPVTDNRLNQAPVTDNRMNQAPVTDNRMNLPPETDNRMNQPPDTDKLNTPLSAPSAGQSPAMAEVQPRPQDKPSSTGPAFDQPPLDTDPLLSQGQQGEEDTTEVNQKKDNDLRGETGGVADMSRGHKARKRSAHPPHSHTHLGHGLHTRQ